MTRKRFVKLLMSHGIQRNKAYQWSYFIRAGKSYSELYTKISLGEEIYHIDIGINVDSYFDAIRGVTKTVAEIAEMIMEGIASS